MTIVADIDGNNSIILLTYGNLSANSLLRMLSVSSDLLLLCQGASTLILKQDALHASSVNSRCIGHRSSLREVITADPYALTQDVMKTDLVTVLPETDQKDVARIVA